MDRKESFHLQIIRATTPHGRIVPSLSFGVTIIRFLSPLLNHSCSKVVATMYRLVSIGHFLLVLLLILFSSDSHDSISMALQHYSLCELLQYFWHTLYLFIYHFINFLHAFKIHKMKMSIIVQCSSWWAPTGRALAPALLDRNYKI